jgi:hypothetical protein
VLQELLNTSVTTVLYLIAFIVQLSIHSTPYYISIRDRNIAAGVPYHFSARTQALMHAKCYLYV